MSNPLLRSDVYFAIWDIERELLDWKWTEADNPAQRHADLLLGRAHFFELLALKDAEILADYERRADNYQQEDLRREQRKQTGNRGSQSNRAPSERNNRAASRRKGRGNGNAPGLYD